MDALLFQPNSGTILNAKTAYKSGLKLDIKIIVKQAQQRSFDLGFVGFHRNGCSMLFSAFAPPFEDSSPSQIYLDAE